MSPLLYRRRVPRLSVLLTCLDPTSKLNKERMASNDSNERNESEAGKVILFGKVFDTLQDLMCYGTELEGRKPLGYQGQEARFFTDLVCGNLHLPDVFELSNGIAPRKGNSGVAYTSPGDPVLYEEVTKNYLIRHLYERTTSMFPSKFAFIVLKLSGMRLPNQVMCCAAALSSTPAEQYSSHSKSSWFRYLTDLGFSVFEDDGTLIKDNSGNSILSIISGYNAKYLFRLLLNKGVTTVSVTHNEYMRIANVNNGILPSDMNKFVWHIQPQPQDPSKKQ